MTSPIVSRNSERWLFLCACTGAVLMVAIDSGLLSPISPHRLVGLAGNCLAVFTAGISQMLFVLAFLLLVVAAFLWLCLRSLRYY